PTAQDLIGITGSGSYLAARHAGQQRDAAAAAVYYREALRQDPKNTELLNRAFLSSLVGGDVDEAVKYAERVAQADKTDRVSRLVLGVQALKRKQFAAARKELAQSVRGPITDLTATLLTSWSAYGAGDSKGAVAAIDRLAGPDWYAIFKDLHAGMILDLAGNEEEAGKRFERAYKLDSSALRVVEAYGSWLSRNGKVDAARKVYGDFNTVLPNHPLVTKALAELGPAANQTKAATPGKLLTIGSSLRMGSRGDDVRNLQAKLEVKADGIFGNITKRAVQEFQRRSELAADGVVGPMTYAKLNSSENGNEMPRQAGGKLPRLVDSAQAGAAEALYGLGASLGRRGGEDLGLVYLQLSLHLAPSHPLALLSLADLYESLKKPALALKVYERVPANSPLHRNAVIQMAANLDALDRSEEAGKRLDALIKARPDDAEAIMALGNILRGHKKFAECADVYSKGVATIAAPVKANWVIFYFRGICYERSKQWPKAEADLKKALALFPDQPHVLNYLGYSWIDQGANLDEGMDMIKRAVQQRPDDGYIVDSLGWAYYRIANYEEAVKNLERAIELKPEDPTINDHLGDAYWRIGRVLEAKFQWAHARDLKPDPEELPKIEEKLKSGLPDETSSQAKAGKKVGNGG
ncbi:MAG TPA: tetratricopeptide repeat protein, partial [Pseudolabrys sp.]|nr:tetratricopeptide repeat protein [Pseudolabrys sp.]